MGAACLVRDGRRRPGNRRALGSSGLRRSARLGGVHRSSRGRPRAVRDAATRRCRLGFQVGSMTTTEDGIGTMARHHYTCSNCGAPFIVIATGGVIAEGAKDAAHRFADSHRYGRTTVVNDHVTLVGPVSDKIGAGRGGAEYQATCSCGWEGRHWPKRAEAQLDGIAHRREAMVIGEEYHRASGHVICDSCRKTYREHPVEEFDGSTRDLADSPLVLHRLCDGSLVKL
jgi:hypothetical protein